MYSHWLVFVIISVDGQEEQHANTSANYDVELLHHKDAHLEFIKSGGYICGAKIWVKYKSLFGHYKICW